MRTKAAKLFCLLGMCLMSTIAPAQGARELKDIVYATVNGKPLGLDLYLPANVRNPALLVWVHGGAWSAGNESAISERVCGEWLRARESRFPPVDGSTLSRKRARHQGCYPVPARERRRVWISHGSHRYRWRVVRSPPRSARRRNERPRGARRRRGRASGSIVERAGHHQLLRCLEPHDDSRSVHTTRIERAPSCARASAGHVARSGKGSRDVGEPRGACRSYRPAAVALARRSGSADAHQSVTRVGRRLREAGARCGFPGAPRSSPRWARGFLRC